MKHTYSSTATLDRTATPGARTTLGILVFGVLSLLAFLASTAFTAPAAPPPPAAPPVAALAPVTVLNSSADVRTVVELAETFRDLLSESQQATLQLDFTEARAQAWSNLPCGSGCRNGVQFSDLSEEQLTAALAVIEEAAGTTDREGFTEFEAIRQAEEALQALGANGYDEGIYFIAFLNAPSVTDAWMLQYGGHHYAMDIAFNQGQVVGATPHFEGVEPLTYTVDGTDYAPMQEEHDNLVALLAGLSTAEQATAELTTSFSDVVLGPDEDGNFPATKVGIQAGTLTDDQRALILAAIDPWLNDIDSVTATTLRSIYKDELDDTYVAFSGSTALNGNGDYARIDGPSVWIEFVCQNGVVIRDQIHYHSIWRDHTRDYGDYLSATSLGDTTSTSVFAPLAATTVTTFPNPAVKPLFIDLRQPVRGARVIVYDLTGRELLRREGVTATVVELDVSELPKGSYLLRVEGGGQLFTGKFQK